MLQAIFELGATASAEQIGRNPDRGKAFAQVGHLLESNSGRVQIARAGLLEFVELRTELVVLGAQLRIVVVPLCQAVSRQRDPGSDAQNQPFTAGGPTMEHLPQ